MSGEADANTAQSELIETVTSIAAAYVSNNRLPVAELADLIKSIHAAVSKLSGATAQPVAVAAPPEPAVPVKKSVTHDFIICLEDGKKFKSMRRHLSGTYNMTPDEYRTKWALPHDYPMVAPGYAATRSLLAKAIGLGKKRGLREAPTASPVTKRSKKAA